MALFGTGANKALQPTWLAFRWQENLGKGKDIRTSLIGIACLVTLALLALGSPSAESAEEPLSGIDLAVSKVLSHNLQTAESTNRLKIQQPRLVSKFYNQMGFRPAWTKGAKVLPEAKELRDALSESFADGLNPDYYNLVDIDVGLRNLEEAFENGGTPTPERIAWIEILMSDAYFAYASDLISGRVKPQTAVEDARTEAIKKELSGFLMRMLHVGWIKDSLERLSPQNSEYQRLKSSLTIYREALSQGKWNTITTQMKYGDHGAGVLSLRSRLKATRDLTPTVEAADEKRFDAAMQKAVMRFQRRHGMAPDGMVGANTLKALNIPVTERILPITLNMERLRWLPRELGDTFVLVNMADLTLKAVHEDVTTMKMKVSIGKDFQGTPSFSSKMTSLVLNPYWNIPEPITRDEIVPIITNSPEYLSDKGIEILRGWDPAQRVVDPHDIDLLSIADPREGYRLRQKPGPSNPLGVIKLVMPNRFNIYLHDTPTSYAFEREVSTFSHGSIRVEKPLELAAFAMRKSPRWTMTKLAAGIATDQRYELNLPEPLNVIVLYQTVWADNDGVVTFSKDIYGRDEELAGALRDSAIIPASTGLPVPAK